MKLLREISCNSPKKLLGLNVYKTFESCRWSLLTISQWTNTTFVISKLGKVSPFLSLVILLLLLPSILVVVVVPGIKSSR